MLASLTLHISQIISGYIIQNLGVRYTFGITALVFIPLFASIFVFVPETVYNRVLQSGAVDVVQKDDSSSLTNTSSNVEKSRPSTAFKLTVFRGRVSSKSFWREVIRPFPLMVYPAVIFSSLIYGSFFTWFVVLTVLSVPIYSSPPYNLNPAQIGLTNLPLLATGMLGSAISGWMVDKIARSMARKNGGIYEPEFRLTLSCGNSTLYCCLFRVWIYRPNRCPTAVVINLFVPTFPSIAICVASGLYLRHGLPHGRCQPGLCHYGTYQSHNDLLGHYLCQWPVRSLGGK